MNMMPKDSIVAPTPTNRPPPERANVDMWVNEWETERLMVEDTSLSLLVSYVGRALPELTMPLERLYFDSAARQRTATRPKLRAPEPLLERHA